MSPARGPSRPAMHTIDRIVMRAPIDRAWAAASDVERWPALLRHYRWVTMLDRSARGAVVEMAAWRPFGPLRYPTWWVSEMETDPAMHVVRYRHIRGITTGMNVEWRLVETDGGVAVTIVHEWTGPRWPLVGPAAAAWVIGPVFVHGIASRTLAGLARAVEAGDA